MARNTHRSKKQWREKENRRARLFLTKWSSMSRVLLFHRICSSPGSIIIGEAWSSRWNGWAGTDGLVRPLLAWLPAADHWNNSTVSFFFPLRLGKQPSCFTVCVCFSSFFRWQKKRWHSLLKFRHPARALPGRMHWKYATSNFHGWLDVSKACVCEIFQVI